MRNYKYLILSAAIMTIAACSDDDGGANGSMPIRLSGSLAVQESRAGTGIQSSAFDTGESVDVFISEYVTAGGSTVSDGYEAPLAYTTAAGGAMSTTATPCFPTDGGGVSIHAFYPSGVVSKFNATAVDFAVKSDQGTDAAYKASDLMYGVPTSNPVSPTSATIPLTFKHLLSKVTITLTAGAGISSVSGAKVELLDVLPEVSLTPSTQALSTAKGTKTDVTVMQSGGTSVSGSAIVVPQALAQQFVRVTLSDGTMLLGQLNDGSTPNLASGYEYKYDITVSLSSLSITATITAWIDGGSKNGTATL